MFEHRGMRGGRIRRFVGFAAMGVVAVAVLGYGAMFLWNALMPPIFGLKARRTAAIVKAVAECDHTAWRVMRDEACQPRQRRGGIVRRQKLAARGVARAFFQMQVGHNKHTVPGPIQHAGRIGDERGT